MIDCFKNDLLLKNDSWGRSIRVNSRIQEMNLNGRDLYSMKTKQTITKYLYRGCHMRRIISDCESTINTSTTEPSKALHIETEL